MTGTKPLPTLEYLKECFELSEQSPSGLIWNLRPRHHFDTDRGYNQIGKGCARKTAGTVVKLPTGKNYWQTQIAGERFYIHRIVYSLANNLNVSIDVEVDHIDGDGLNNKPANLRKAESCENSHNAKKYKNNNSGFKGVGYCKNSKSWMGRVMCRGVLHHIRGCPTPEKADELLRELREQLHKKFTNHGNHKKEKQHE